MAFIARCPMNMHVFFQRAVLRELHRERETDREGTLTQLMGSNLIKEMLRSVFHNSYFSQRGYLSA